jgi:signal peptidase II
MTGPTAWRLGAAAAVTVVALDQLTKWWVVDVIMQPPRQIEITPFLNLVMAWNRGVSFGLLRGDSPWHAYVLIAVAAVIALALSVWLARTTSRLVALALGLIVGGAVGNIIDRLRFGAVADFIDVHAAGLHWPAFNVADSAITVGATILVVEALLRPREKR